jgi:hypothetical protein
MPHALPRAQMAAMACAAAAALLTIAGDARAGQTLKVTAKPGLTPSFRTDVSDYVSTCAAARPLRLSIATPSSESASVDGAHPRSGRFTVTVSLKVGQATDFVARSGSQRQRYHVRCVPTRFPHWTFERAGTPQAQWSLMAPVGNRSSRFVIFVDSHGVPVWWKKMAVPPFNSLLLPNGDLAWTRWYKDPFGENSAGAWEIHRLDGSLVRTLKTIGSPTDTHDMQPLANGNFLLDTYRLRKHVDLRPYGGQANSNVMDGEIQEITPAGKRVWSWNSKDHINLDEAGNPTGRQVRLRDGTVAYDVFHLNSVEPDGDGLVISARHVNAVYRIKRATGDVVWKLGGTPRPERLAVVGDPKGPTFGGQHDARLLGDGTLTVYDNRTGIDAPRGVRFAIDTKKHEATFLEQVSDPNATSSNSKGSARRLPSGDWVVSWGGTTVISEVSRTTGVVWRLTFGDKTESYRTTPIPYGELKAVTLRRAMDRMHPR